MGTAPTLPTWGLASQRPHTLCGCARLSACGLLFAHSGSPVAPGPCPARVPSGAARPPPLRGPGPAHSALPPGPGRWPFPPAHPLGPCARFRAPWALAVPGCLWARPSCAAAFLFGRPCSGRPWPLCSACHPPGPPLAPLPALRPSRRPSGRRSGFGPGGSCPGACARPSAGLWVPPAPGLRPAAAFPPAGVPPAGVALGPRCLGFPSVAQARCCGCGRGVLPRHTPVCRPLRGALRARCLRLGASPRPSGPPRFCPINRTERY